jgi:hypothetical protein
MSSQHLEYEHLLILIINNDCRIASAQTPKATAMRRFFAIAPRMAGNRLSAAFLHCATAKPI